MKVNGTVKMQEEVAKVEDFKYLGSSVQSNGECGREVKKIICTGSMKWVEKNVRSDLRQIAINVVRVGYGGTDEDRKRRRRWQS